MTSPHEDPANAPRLALMREIAVLEGEGINQSIEARRERLRERTAEIEEEQARIDRDERALSELRIALDRLGGPIPEENDEPPF
ncbi:hypothetical protein [Phycicoccus sp.]|uniref:hypothetical protein n=1 Tax=Phycicoccus sp. TaxID=1902410 RepID=UPI002BA0CBDB|nr:hypothetical protein [Phycicoccus sp.]HMM95342.1 hypothetical protein [Phycicoccus sp.]